MIQVFISALVVLVCIFLVGALNDNSCAVQARRMGLEQEYGWSEGCMIRVNQQWVPIDNYRVVGEAP